MGIRVKLNNGKKKKFTLQIGQNELVIVTAREQVVSRRGKTYASDVSGVGLEALHGSTASDVEEDAAAVLVAGHQKTPRRIDAERRYRASHLQRDQMLIRRAILIPFHPLSVYVR